ncbi:MAG: PDZ domain-containing protein [Calditrichae bacterium]|nr:PDZ domain-containing protein [Calditrichota bacterium]MCB9058381.1 PDZ domain-containing protein [Calditrichia bacterium]
MRYFRMFTVFSFVLLAFNCSAADGTGEQKIVVKKAGNYFSLGVVISELSDKDKENLKSDEGARILHVLEKSAAEEAGLQKDDVIVEFDGEEIESARELNDIVEKIEEPRTVSVSVLREGSEKSFDVKLKKLEERNYSFAFSNDGEDGAFSVFNDDKDLTWVGEGPGKHIIVNKIGTGNASAFHVSDSKGGFLGVSTENLTKQMLEYFEVEHGVLVEEVVEDSPAEKAGLKAGDVITFIEDRKIESYNDLTRTINYYNPDEEISIDFVRKGSQKSTKAILTKKQNSSFFFGGDNDLKIEIPDPVAAPPVIKEFNWQGGKVGTIFVI